MAHKILEGGCDLVVVGRTMLKELSLNSDIKFWRSRLRALKWKPERDAISWQLSDNSGDDEVSDEGDIPAFLRKKTGKAPIHIEATSKKVVNEITREIEPQHHEMGYLHEDMISHNNNVLIENIFNWHPKIILVFFSISISALLFLFGSEAGGVSILSFSTFLIWRKLI